MNILTRSNLRRLAALGAAGSLALGIAACSDDDDANNATGTTSSAAAPATDSETVSGQGLTLTDGYVAAKGTEKSMTAVFGELTNSTDKDIHLTRAVGSLAGVYQYHEVIDGVMQEMDNGLTVPANGSMTLQPGGKHIMIMENNDEIAAGDELSLTLTGEDGTTYEIDGIPVRVQQSGQEDYGTDGMSGTGSADGTDSAHATAETDGH